MYFICRFLYRYTGYQLHELKEENGTYYTEDGTDIKTVIREEVWKDPIFPYEAKEDYAQAVCGCIQEVAEWGWQNVPDMVLSIGYSSAGLHDLGQDISFDYGSEWYKQYLDIFSVACQCAPTITQKTGEILPPVFVLPVSLSSVILFVTEISSQTGISIFI